MSPMSQFCSRDDQQVLERQPTDEQHEDEAIVEESRNPSTATGEERTPTDASLMTAFREFFLSAFSDRYQETYCCGADTGFLQETAVVCCNVAGSRGRVAPDPESIRTQNSSANSSYNELQKSASQDSRKRRKKPLAIAVGFNYAEDMDGRPVIITQRKPNPPRAAPPRRHSPASVPTTSTSDASYEQRASVAAT